MKKTFIVLFGILCLCLIFVSCSPSSNSKSGSKGKEDEEPTTAQLVITVDDYTSKADFEKKIPKGVTYSWSDSKGKSEKNLTYTGESDTITIYPTYGSNVDVDFEWTTSDGEREYREIVLNPIVGTKCLESVDFDLK